MPITIGARIVHTVADLRVGDRLPEPTQPGGYIQIAELASGTGLGGWPLSIIDWVHNQAENGAPSRWLDFWEINDNGHDGYRLDQPPVTRHSKQTSRCR